MRLISLCALILLLAACGSGGGSSSAPAAPGTGSGGGSSGGGSGAPTQTWQQEMLASVNGHRTNGVTAGGTTHPPVGALTWNDLLAQAAERYARDMHDNNAWDHVGSDGSTVSQRVTDTGYAWGSVGENIAKGQTSVTQVMDAWINSSGHRANIMSSNYTQVGFARVGNSWVQVFGRPLSGVSQRIAPVEVVVARID